MNATTVGSVEPDEDHPSTNPLTAGRIVVGVDGSAGSLAALDWAVHEAQVRGVALHVVMAWQHPAAVGGPNLWALGMDPSAGTQHELAKAATREVERLAQGSEVDVDITYEAVEGHPAQTLILRAEGAAMLVVGSRGHGGFVGALLGSISHHVVARATCPVVVVPHPEHDRESVDNGSAVAAHQNVAV